ncbi:hypothetical protein CEP51_002726 [Fusarium floridanum]|uniref:Cyanovirin-N domain-containing protein n=1 Tax=Fusarium floridanum TaxID=1325733 RepID=A0A428SA21_9HYPO|nr:hypothetical protein CEP51_002726 [Fusarium floridanum]
MDDMRLFHGHILVVTMFEEGIWRDTSLDLDPYIGNRNGRLTWGYEYNNYSREARNIRLIRDPDGWTPNIHTTLKDRQRNDKDSAINLTQCICIRNYSLICRPELRFLTEPVRNDAQGIIYFKRIYS